MKQDELPISSTQEYAQWLQKLKEKVRSSRLKAAVKVNAELLDLYWNMGKEMVEKQKQYAWGDSFIKNLSKDLKHAFPDMKGFSEQNLMHIRYWYTFYSASSIVLQPVRQLQDIETLIKSIPWGHNQRIMYKCCDINEAVFYVQKTIENGWSRNVLEHQIELCLYERSGKAVNNFDVCLPALQSDLAKQTLKDPYTFDFLTLREAYNEKELEKALVGRITDFLLELGNGFSYIGKQVPLQVGNSSFYIDLLFYHTKLHCYVVVELKTEAFKPEFIGQLNFYITAVNKDIKTEIDNQTIGILICKDKDTVVAEYALESSAQPIGITKYELTKLLKEEFRSTLPSIEEIEQSLKNGSF